MDGIDWEKMEDEIGDALKKYNISKSDGYYEINEQTKIRFRGIEFEGDEPISEEQYQKDCDNPLNIENLTYKTVVEVK